MSKKGRSSWGHTGERSSPRREDAQGASGRPSRGGDSSPSLELAETVAWALLTAAALIPIWLYPYFPSQDGPAHVETARALLRFHADPIYREYYALNVSLGTNLVMTTLLGGLMTFLEPAVAEKVVVSGYVVLFAASCRYALGAIAPDRRWLSVLALPIAYNLLLHMGFYNYCIGLACFPLVVGLVLRRRPLSWRSTLWLAALLTLIYLMHPVPFLFSAAATVLLTAVPWAGVGAALRGVATTLVPLGLMLRFVVRDRAPDRVKIPTPALVRLDDFAFLRSYHDAELWTCAGLYALLGLLLLHWLASGSWRRGTRRASGLFLVFVMTVAVYLASPDAAGGGSLLKMRLPVFIVIVGLLWLATPPFGPWIRRGLLAASLALAAAHLVLVSRAYAEANAGLVERHALEGLIPEGSTILPVEFDPWGRAGDGGRPPSGVRPFVHAASLLAAGRRSVSLFNYQGSFDFFSLIYRRDRNPYDHIRNYDSSFLRGAPLRFLDYPERTGGRVDYVLVSGLRPAYVRTPNVGELARQLDAAYERIGATPGGGVLLFHRKAGR